MPMSHNGTSNTPKSESTVLIDDLLQRVWQQEGWLPQKGLSLLAVFILLRWFENIETDRADSGGTNSAFPNAWSSVNLINEYQKGGEEGVEALERLLSGSHEALQILLDRNEYIPKEILQFAFRTLPESSDYYSIPDDVQLVLSTTLFWLSAYEKEDKKRKGALARAYDELLESTFKVARYGGEDYTPQSIANLMVDLIDPRPGESIYDPCFGTGGLLSTAVNKMRGHEYEYSPMTLHQESDIHIYGSERNELTYALGLARVILSGIMEPNLFCKDTLLEASSVKTQDKFDCIIAHLPFGGRVHHNQQGLFNSYPIKSRSTDNLFIQHILTSLKEGGRAVILVNDSILFSRWCR